MNTTVKLVANTRRKPGGGAPIRAASGPGSSSSGPDAARSIQIAPPRNNPALAKSITDLGARVSSPPATTDRVTCTAKAAATPSQTWPGRYRVPSTSDANKDLSGSSARNVTAKTVTSSNKLDTRASLSGSARPGTKEPRQDELNSSAKVSFTPCQGPDDRVRSRTSMSISQRGITPLQAP